MIETRETESTMENLNNIIKELELKLATITPFVIWDQHGTRNFNNDSISDRWVLYSLHPKFML